MKHTGWYFNWGVHDSWWISFGLSGWWSWRSADREPLSVVPWHPYEVMLSPYVLPRLSFGYALIWSVQTRCLRTIQWGCTRALIYLNLLSLETAGSRASPLPAQPLISAQGGKVIQRCRGAQIRWAKACTHWSSSPCQWCRQFVPGPRRFLNTMVTTWVLRAQIRWAKGPWRFLNIGATTWVLREERSAERNAQRIIVCNIAKKLQLISPALIFWNDYDLRF